MSNADADILAELAKLLESIEEVIRDTPKLNPAEVQEQAEEIARASEGITLDAEEWRILARHSMSLAFDAAKEVEQLRRLMSQSRNNREEGGDIARQEIKDNRDILRDIDTGRFDDDPCVNPRRKQVMRDWLEYRHSQDCPTCPKPSEDKNNGSL